jgi:hypothetical protein
LWQQPPVTSNARIGLPEYNLSAAKLAEKDARPMTMASAALGEIHMAVADVPPARKFMAEAM